mgnify:FL=1
MQINIRPKTLVLNKPCTLEGGLNCERLFAVISIVDEGSDRIGIGECLVTPETFDMPSGKIDPEGMMQVIAGLVDKALRSEDYTAFLRPYPALLFALESAMFDYQKNPLLYDTPFAHREMGIPVVSELPEGSLLVRPMLDGGITGAIERIRDAQQKGKEVVLGATCESNVGLRNIALLAGRVAPFMIYIPDYSYKENIEMDIEIRGGKLWRCEVDE